MKKNLPDEIKRMMQIMENVEGSTILTELNMQYLDQLLDKVSSGGVESLDDYEKDALQKMSQDQDVNPPEKHSLGMTDSTLRFTPMNVENDEPMIRPEDPGELFGQAAHEEAYFDDDIRDLTGMSRPIFLDGDLSQLDMPEEEQEIRMLLPQGEYECVARVEPDGIFYQIGLRQEEDLPDEDEMVEQKPFEDMANDGDFLNEDMGEYKVYDDDLNLVNEVKDENDMRVYNIFDDLEEEKKNELKEKKKVASEKLMNTLKNEAEGFASQVDADADQMGDIEQTEE
jgi:hypothetical protein